LFLGRYSLTVTNFHWKFDREYIFLGLPRYYKCYEIFNNNKNTNVKKNLRNFVYILLVFSFSIFHGKRYKYKKCMQKITCKLSLSSAVFLLGSIVDKYRKIHLVWITYLSASSTFFVWPYTTYLVHEILLWNTALIS